MIDMKIYNMLLIFLFISLKGLSQQFDIKSILLNEYEIIDTVFLEGISTLVLSDSAYFIMYFIYLLIHPSPYLAAIMS
jgi:hypothetical protein